MQGQLNCTCSNNKQRLRSERSLKGHQYQPATQHTNLKSSVSQPWQPQEGGWGIFSHPCMYFEF